MVHVRFLSKNRPVVAQVAPITPTGVGIEYTLTSLIAVSNLFTSAKIGKSAPTPSS